MISFFFLVRALSVPLDFFSHLFGRLPGVRVLCPFDFSTELDEVRAFMVSYSPFLSNCTRGLCVQLHICVRTYTGQCKMRREKKRERSATTTTTTTAWAAIITLWSEQKKIVHGDKCTKCIIHIMIESECACVGALFSLLWLTLTPNQTWIQFPRHKLTNSASSALSFFPQ